MIKQLLARLWQRLREARYHYEWQRLRKAEMAEEAARQLTVVAINKDRRLALTSDGTQLPISKCFDSRGEDCEPDEAVAFVAGAGSRWFAIDAASVTSVH